ncbi:MAG: LptF/LptG family permease, partial [Deltaproteobacteria bacterium]|nr:LptF/LptG family permease [Deltaproteobacteria bacterium]
MRSTLFRYISLEIWPVFFVSLMVFIFIIMAASMMDIIDLVINQGVSTGRLTKIILWMLPQIILFSLPAACLMSVMLAFLRLAGDNEIIALNASGVSLYQMLPPVIFFSLATYIASGFLAIYGVPWGNRSYKDYKSFITKSKTNLTIKERVFYDEIDNLVFYVNSFSTSEKVMKDIFIVDESNKDTTTTIVAESGMVTTGTTPNTINLHLNNGTVFINEPNSNKASPLNFITLDYPIYLGDIASSSAGREKKPKEMYLRELRSSLKSEDTKPSKRNEIGIRLYEMFSIPAAIFILGIIGAYLGSHVKARGRTAGIIISLIVFLIYYISLMGSRYLCEMGIVPPVIGVWSPVVLLMIISVVFL